MVGMPLHSLRTAWRSEWQMPQKRISIWTSCAVGSRRSIVVAANGDVALVTEYAFALYMDRPRGVRRSRERSLVVSGEERMRPREPRKRPESAWAVQESFTSASRRSKAGFARSRDLGL